MTTEAQKKIRAKRARRPVYLLVRKLIDPETGELVGALVPSNGIDARLMRERRMASGREVRAELKQPRNGAFHRLAHIIGNLLVDNVEEFRFLTSHDALKRVQTESGVCCYVERLEIDLGELGRHETTRLIPRSIAYDEMDDAEFGEFFRGVCDYIDEHYQSVMTDSVRDEYMEITAGNDRRIA